MGGGRRRRRAWEVDADEPTDEEEGQWAHEVDLHGCTVVQAQRRLLEELTRCRASGRSPVLVITGKGFGSLGGKGVLGPAVKAWLEGPDGRGVGVRAVRALEGRGAFDVELQRRAQ
ncbi:MAG: Smr/MutS family protein [Planctomycetota bacterium]